MALSDILQKINDEANKKAAFMKQVADDEIVKIKEEAMKKAEERRKDIAERAGKKAESVREKAEVLAKMEGRNKLLSEKRQVIDEVYAEVSKELSQLGEVELNNLLVSMLKTASKSLPKGHVIAPKGKKAEIEGAISKAGVSYTVKEECSSIKGGFIVSDGKQEINLSFDYLLKSQVRPQTELDVAKTLFN